MVTYNYMLGMFASMAISSSCDKVSGRIGNCSIDKPSVCFFLNGTNVNLGSAGFTCILLQMMTAVMMAPLSNNPIRIQQVVLRPNAVPGQMNPEVVDEVFPLNFSSFILVISALAEHLVIV